MKIVLIKGILVAVIVAILVADAQPERNGELQKQCGKRKKLPEMQRKLSGMQGKQSGMQGKPPAVMEDQVSLLLPDIQVSMTAPVTVEDNKSREVQIKDIAK